MITIRNLTHRYKNRSETALQNINLHIERGEVVVLLGLSGAGKSTLIKCIDRLIEPTCGSILINGKDILTANTKKTEELRRSIGLIFQEFNLIERTTVLDNVLNGRLGYIGVVRTFFNKFRTQDYEIAENNLRQVGLFDLRYERASNLSGGQRQRVAIARVLSQEPQIILADEPVSSLDPKLMKEIMDLLQRLCREKGIALVTSLHFLEFVKKYASRVVGLRDGIVVFDGSIQDITEKDLVCIYGEAKDWHINGKTGF